MALDIALKGALSLEKIGINAPSQFTVAISTDEDVAVNAAQRWLDLDRQTTVAISTDEDVAVNATQRWLDLDRQTILNQTEEIIMGQMRQDCPLTRSTAPAKNLSVKFKGTAKLSFPSLV